MHVSEINIKSTLSGIVVELIVDLSNFLPFVQQSCPCCVKPFGDDAFNSRGSLKCVPLLPLWLGLGLFTPVSFSKQSAKSPKVVTAMTVTRRTRDDIRSNT